MRNLLVVAVVVVVVDIGFGWVDIVGILQVDIEVVVGIEFDLVGIVEIIVVFTFVNKYAKYLIALISFTYNVAFLKSVINGTISFSLGSLQLINNTI